MMSKLQVVCTFAVNLCNIVWLAGTIKRLKVFRFRFLSLWNTAILEPSTISLCGFRDTAEQKLKIDNKVHTYRILANHFISENKKKSILKLI